MSATTTGLEPWFDGPTGVDYVHELVRQGARVLAEVTSEATDSTTTPRPVSILRREETVAGNSARGIASTWAAVAGLDDLFGVVFMPGDWNDRQADPNALRLKEGERVVLILDVPAGGNVAANRIVPTDRVGLDDPVYGTHAFEIITLSIDEGAGMVRAHVRYAREESA